jgi:hypothetical protein
MEQHLGELIHRMFKIKDKTSFDYIIYSFKLKQSFFKK